MKLAYFLGFLTFFSFGMWQAFSPNYNNLPSLRPRQKAEVIYRNLQMAEKLWTTQDENYEKYLNELGNILGQNPFMNKKDKFWLNGKIKEAKIKSSQVVVVRTVQK